MKRFLIGCVAAATVGLATYFILEYLGMNGRLASAIGGGMGGFSGSWVRDKLVKK